MIQIQVTSTAHVTQTQNQIRHFQGYQIKILSLSAMPYQFQNITKSLSQLSTLNTLLTSHCKPILQNLIISHIDPKPKQLLSLLIVFSFFRWSQFHHKFDFDQVFIEVFLTLFGSFFIITYVYSFIVLKPSGVSTSIVGSLLKFVIYFIVPFMQLNVSVITKTSQRKVDHFFQSIAIISSIFITTISTLYLKFKIKPLRKNNIFWRYTNQYELQRFLLQIARTIIFLIDGISILSLIISMGLEYALILRITKYHQAEYLLQITTSSNIIMSVHAGLLCNKILNDPQLAVKLLVFLVLISLLKGFHDYFNQKNKQLLFPLCSETPHLFYDYYFRLYDKYNEKNAHGNQSDEKFYNITLKEHNRRCKTQKCPLKNVCLVKKYILEQVENIVSQILRNNKNFSPDLQILEELWKLQLGKKFTFRQIQEMQDLQTEFIIFSIKKSEKSRDYDFNTANLISEGNLQKVNNLFYEPLMKVLISFSEFYTEILKPKPKIQSMTSIGERLKRQVQNVQKIYLDLLKKKVINFRGIELYIHFESYFTKSNSLSAEMLKKITLIQKNTVIEDIEQIYLPAINFYPQSLLIEDVNMECLSFLRYSRFELKTKMISDIVLPNFKIASYFEMNQKQSQSSLMFIKKKSTQFICGNIRINVKFVNNKKILVMVFEKKKRHQGTNFILVNDDFEIIEMTTKVENFRQKKHPQQITLIDWKDIFETYLKPHQRQLKMTKLIKVDIKALDSILMCSLNKTLNNVFYIIELKMMKNLKDVVQERRSIVCLKSGETLLSVGKRNTFSFSFDIQDQKKLILRGQKSLSQNIDKRRSKTQTLDYFAHKVRLQVVDFTLIKNQQFSKGIKTYRLIGSDLYNVDLEDKQAYVSAFDDMRRNSSENQSLGKSAFDVYIITLVIIIALVLTGLSFYLFISMDINMQIIDDDFARINEINTFKMDFYRIMAMLRDVASGLYESLGRDWRADVMESYNNIQSNLNKKMFSNKEVQINYQDFPYMGNLNQIIQVILSDVFVLAHQWNSVIDIEVIQYIHKTSIQQLTSMIQNEDEFIENRIVQYLINLKNLKDLLIIGIFVGITAFYSLIFYFGFNLVAKMKQNLNELMMISDNEARYGMENSQRLIYVIQMAKKNFEVDLKNLLPPKKSFRPRKKQKQIVVGPYLKYFSVGLLIALFLINIAFILAFNLILDQSFENLKTMKLQGQTLIGIYSDLCRQTNSIDHTKKRDINVLIQIRKQLVNIDAYLDELKFKQQTNENIKRYFLYDSCPMIYQNKYISQNVNTTCERATPGYLIESPFTMGLVLYFTRLHYQIIDNIEDTFAATGVYSSIFSKVFTEMSRSIKKDESQILDEFILSTKIWCICLIMINLFYCIFAVMMSIYVKKKGKSVEMLIKFLNPRQKTQNRNNTIAKKNIIEKNEENKRKEKPKKRTQRFSILANQVQP